MAQIYTSNNSSFPNQVVSDAEKATEEFGLQIGQAIQYEWFRKDGQSCRYYSQWRDFNRLRLYARGEQSIAKYKTELAVDGDLSYLNLDWTPVPIIPKFVDIVVNGLAERMYDIKAYSQDPHGVAKRTEHMESLLADYQAKPLNALIEETKSDGSPGEKLPITKRL